ncbi:MAG: hypothetical protein JSS36_03155 [Proteobacteria bacterium]|nr:hypothetical protein [Pseudomonadota bacterium]
MIPPSPPSRNLERLWFALGLAVPSLVAVICVAGVLRGLIGWSSLFVYTGIAMPGALTSACIGLLCRSRRMRQQAVFDSYQEVLRATADVRP